MITLKRKLYFYMSSNPNKPSDLPVFYEPTDIPKFWTLYDIAFWIALQRPAQASYDFHGNEARESDDDIGEQIARFGNAFAGGISENECERARLGRSPWAIQQEREDQGKRYLLSPDYYDKQLKFHEDGNDLEEKYLREMREDRPLAIAHDKYETDWNLNLEEYLSVAFSKIFVALREGTMAALGTPTPTPDANADKWDEIWQYLADKSIVEERIKIAPENWKLKNIGWQESWLWGNELIFFAVVVPAIEVFSLFPATVGKSFNASIVGEFILLEVSDAPVKPKRKLGGRPSKDWAKIDLRVAEIISKDGYLPSKQSALAGELTEWYEATVGDKISRSAVMDRLKSFYKSDVIQKQ